MTPEGMLYVIGRLRVRIEYTKDEIVIRTWKKSILFQGQEREGMHIKIEDEMSTLADGTMRVTVF